MRPPDVFGGGTGPQTRLSNEQEMRKQAVEYRKFFHHQEELYVCTSVDMINYMLKDPLSGFFAVCVCMPKKCRFFVQNWSVNIFSFQ